MFPRRYIFQTIILMLDFWGVVLSLKKVQQSKNYSSDALPKRKHSIQFSFLGWVEKESTNFSKTLTPLKANYISDLRTKNWAFWWKKTNAWDAWEPQFFAMVAPKKNWRSFLNLEQPTKTIEKHSTPGVTDSQKKTMTFSQFNSDAGQTTKMISPTFRFRKFSGSQKSLVTKHQPTLGAPKNSCLRSFRYRPALATLSASFSAFTWCTFRDFFWGSETLDKGREPTEHQKSGGHYMTPTHTTNFFSENPSKNCVGRFAWSFWFLQDGYLFFLIKTKMEICQITCEHFDNNGLPVIA